MNNRISPFEAEIFSIHDYFFSFPRAKRFNYRLQSLSAKKMSVSSDKNVAFSLFGNRVRWGNDWKSG